MNIVVCVKQVMDPDTPISAFIVDEAEKKVIPAQGIPPVVNGYCENAVEAALQIRDQQGEGTITILSLGTDFVMDVMKKPLSMGADKMILIQDESASNLDASGIVNVLSAAINKISDVDLVLCGQQASDWDNAHIPMGLAENLELPCITSALNIEHTEDKLIVQSALPDGYQTFEAPLRSLITVNNLFGEPRYPTLKGIMQASRNSPEIWSIDDLGISKSDLEPSIILSELKIPVSEGNCEIIEGEDDADSGRLLALKLREEKII